MASRQRKSHARVRSRASSGDSQSASEPVRVRIDSLAAGGDGVGRLADGRAIFVPYTAPGDLAEVRVTELHARFARGALERLVEPGPERATPRCSLFGACGGCDWQHLEYSAQLRAKSEIVKAALARIGGMSLAEAPDVTPSPSAYGYRGRARVLRERGRVGFRARASNELCATTSCPVLQPGLEAELARLASEAANDPIGASPSEWEIALGASGEVRAVSLSRSHSTAPPPLELRVLGETLAISPGGFAQASPLLFDAFAACVLDAVCAELAPGTRVVELHAGAGFFTLPLARRVQEICAVESDLRAVEDLRRNLGRAGSSHVEVVREQAGVFLARQVRSARGDRPRIGCVLLDPPRTGLERGAARNLAALAPAQIVYVSCDPATLARDARELTARGYSLTSLRAFDLFPQTAHVEVVSQWRRARRESIG